MRYVPESAEVVRETLSELQGAIGLGAAINDPSIPMAEFLPKFLQGCYFVSQYTLVIFTSIRYYLEVIGKDVTMFSFNDLMEFQEDEHRVIMDGLFKNFILGDSENFRQLMVLSYCQGFDAVAPWFLAMVTALTYLEGVATGAYDGYDEEDRDGEEDEGEEGYS